jgi:hypothetical protein
MLKKKNIANLKNKNIVNSYFFFYFIPEANAFRDW